MQQHREWGHATCVTPGSLHLLVIHVIIVACPHPLCCCIYKCKNISIKMLKDVGMTVPKRRETRAVYMQDEGMQQQ